MEWAALAILGAATLAGALVQAVTGFGFAIVAAPIFLAVVGSTTAIPILAALHVVQSAQLVPGLWREASRAHLGRMLAGGLIGCPAGLVLLQALDVRGLKILVGMVILAATLLLVVRERLARNERAPPADLVPAPGAGAVATGFLAGAMTALLVMPGPPLMVYLAARPLAKDAARALSLTFFAACYVAVTALNGAGGMLPAPAWTTIALLTPAVIAGTLLGLRLAPHLSEARFRSALLVLLALSGIGAILSAMAG